MAEIEAEILEPNLPLNIRLQVPSDTDSVFYVSGDSDSPEVVETNFYKENGLAYIDKEITDKNYLEYRERSISYLAEKALRKMSVRVKLKNLTTDIVQMGFNHVVPLIQVPCDTQKSKNRFQVLSMYVEKCQK